MSMYLQSELPTAVETVAAASDRDNNNALLEAKESQESALQAGVRSRLPVFGCQPAVG